MTDEIPEPFRKAFTEQSVSTAIINVLSTVFARRIMRYANEFAIPNVPRLSDLELSELEPELTQMVFRAMKSGTE